MEVTDHGQASETGLPGSDHGALPQGGSSRQGEDTGRVLRRLRLPPQVCDPTAGAQEINFAARSARAQAEVRSPAVARSPAPNLAGLGPVVRQATEGRVALVVAEHGALPKAVRAGLLAASASTLDRLLKAARVAHPKGLSGTKPGTLLKKQIPIRCEHWDVSQPGFVGADTVAHCGNSLAGDFAWSLTMTDILTGWTECRAIWNKGAQGVIRHEYRHGPAPAILAVRPRVICPARAACLGASRYAR